jgi:hypothetical protein
MAGYGQEGAGGNPQAHFAAATAASLRQLPLGQGFTGFMHVHRGEFHAVVDQDQNVILMRDSAALCSGTWLQCHGH